MIKSIAENKLFISRLKHHALARRINLVLLLVAIVFVTALNVWIPRLIGGFSSQVIQSSLTQDSTVLIVIVFLAKIGFQYCVSFQTHFLSKYLTIFLKRDLLQLIVNSEQSCLDKYKKGDLLERVFNELGQLQGKMVIGFIYFIKDLLFLAALLIGVLIISRSLFFSLSVFTLLFSIYNRFFGGRVEKNAHSIQILNAELTSFFWEVISGKKDVFILNLRDKIFGKWEKYLLTLKREFKHLARLRGFHEITLEVLIAMFILTIVAILSSSDNIENTVSLLAYVLMLTWPVKEINNYLVSMRSLLPSLRRVENLLEALLPKKQQVDLRKKSYVYCDHPKIGMDIVNLNYCYDKHQDNLFEDYGLKFHPGFYLIQGANGSGKTTLAEILTGIRTPASGKIIFRGPDSNTGKVSPVKLVTQNPFLFNDTILNNLKINTDADPDQINHKLEIYGLGSFFDQQTLEKKVGENGIFLSGGEKQVISIIRAVLANPDILILDEINNNLPANIYDRLVKTLYQERRDKITVLISHQTPEIKLEEKISL
ncbi:ABC transporter ATP-binding protein [Fulvivirgaceae bacterium BMA10]|uniref:ABC transporter ATP-binding protein n=1 Tax=Splendidivirga corallicola TaxID=3051826 RepID=A0ABT8KK77_9BACT|nr:ABC transporter ATP-binding protein [Fulvivirgaceae bacterium BMA10]